MGDTKKIIKGNDKFFIPPPIKDEKEYHFGKRYRIEKDGHLRRLVTMVSQNASLLEYAKHNRYIYNLLLSIIVFFLFFMCVLMCVVLFFLFFHRPGG